MVNTEDLQSSCLFFGAEKQMIDKAASLASEAAFESGEYIYHRGDRGTAFYIVTEGKVELLIDDPDRLNSVAGHVRTGGHFGEVSLLTGNPCCYTARALTRVHLIVFNETIFQSTLLANKANHSIFNRTLIERLALASFMPVASQPFKENLSNNSFEEEYLSGGLLPLPLTPSDQDEIEFMRAVKKKVHLLASRKDPALIVGETGAGRRKVAQQIHMEGSGRSVPYAEVDLRNFEPWIWDEKLFGRKEAALPCSEGCNQGIFEQMRYGTVVFFHAELLAPGLQRKLARTISKGTFAPCEGQEEERPLSVRLIFIVATPPIIFEQEAIFLPEFRSIFHEDQILVIPPLRERKREIPPLANYYLRHWSREYGKKVRHISPQALGLLMKYDWPGNLTELVGVIQRAVIASQDEEILSEQILLGLQRSEGKMVYNILRFPWIRQLISNRFFPDIPRLIILILFCMGMSVLLLGPREASQNIGITLSWFVGWPLLMISFFFLPRFWCSVCALSAPGAFLQKIIHPRFQVPAFLITHSGWIMALLCLSVFWVEIVWNAYNSPLITAGIMGTIASGSLICSILFQRSAWCRYLCPLGALNGIFSMPSVLELRANRQLCDNQCHEHACYKGTPSSPGCPMFRHPFLVDNNHDCILCGRCIKNCRLQSIQLNLRLAPHELWLIQTPRLMDSLLVAGLAAIFFPLSKHHDFLELIAGTGLPVNPILVGSLFFWSLIAFLWACYSLMAWAVAVLGGTSVRDALAALGYGLIPLVLGGYLAVHVRLMLNESWRLIPNLLLLFGISYSMTPLRLFSEIGMSTLLHIIILGGLICSLYAVRKIVIRLSTNKPSFLSTAAALTAVLVLGIFYLRMI